MDEKEKLVSYSAKITQENRDRLERIKEEMNLPTMNELFDNLIDRFYSPIKVNRENAQLIEALKKQLEESTETLHARNGEIQELTAWINTCESELEQLKSRKENTLLDLLPPGATVLRLEPITIKILEYVAEIEGRRRKQEWHPEHVIDYFVHSRFIKGELNGNLNSVPDSAVAKIKKEIAHDE
jgi:chromosome segregation ATPase